MKNLKLTLIAILIGSGAIAQTAESVTDSDSLGVIGDNLDLAAVLNTFKDAESVEAFEKAINDPETKLNNLDLNEDDEVDYIQVIDETEDDAHAFILRVDLDDSESQDVAVIELEKTAEGTAQIQIVGDEEIYGEDYILEPQGEESVTKRVFVPALIVVNVWSWRCVRFVYAPAYRPYRSPWRWRRYPAWYRPWKPIRWRAYHAHSVRHHPRRFHRVRTRRCVTAHRVFHNHRRTTVRVRNHPNHHSRNAHRGHGPNHGHKAGTKSAGTKGASHKGGQKTQHGKVHQNKGGAVKSTNKPHAKQGGHKPAQKNGGATGGKKKVNSGNAHGGAKKGSVQKRNGGAHRSGGAKKGNSTRGGSRR